MVDARASLAQDAIQRVQEKDEAEKKIKRKQVEKGLQKIYTDLRAGKLTAEQAQKAIEDLIAPFGLTLADMGDMLDTSDLQDALHDLEDAIKALIAELKAQGKGPPPPPPPSHEGTAKGAAPSGGSAAPPGAHQAGTLAKALSQVLPKGAVVEGGGGGRAFGYRPRTVEPIDYRPRMVEPVTIDPRRLAVGPATVTQTATHNINVGGIKIEVQAAPGQSPEQIADAVEGRLVDSVIAAIDAKSLNNNGAVFKFPPVKSRLG
jgi:hypothetical protein